MMSRAVKPFPKEKLVPGLGYIKSDFVDSDFIGMSDAISHKIYAPILFKGIEFQDGPEDVKGSICIEYFSFVQGLFPGFKALEGREFHFPIDSEEEGWAESTIYFFCHSTIDVPRIRIRKVEGDILSVSVNFSWEFRRENIGYDDAVEQTLDLDLKIEGVEIKKDLIAERNLTTRSIPEYLQQFFTKRSCENPKIGYQGTLNYQDVVL
ncbi:MAG TPA: hypothetical protein VE954_27435 [Oligoflexus sp.]|uniref:hypothetical protein n=1 Tax=Oligoflexus sp. TaxID=1971216 RepID=UPI002D4BE8B3|nr:hypothetical protein [Oligoflexus sp.]HYX36858.1 hypothetical protein [Oligoflexus sp.]